MERFLRQKLPDGDFVNVEPKHRRIMKGVRGKGNKTTELCFKEALSSAGMKGWELNSREIQGCPDFFFQKEKLAIFLDGCFWHGCPKCGHIPQKNSIFWNAKINRNKERDVHITAILRRKGISVLRFWEHDIQETLDLCIEIVRKKINERIKKLETSSK